jgi:transformation/transcription domain-associated protein
MWVLTCLTIFGKRFADIIIGLLPLVLNTALHFFNPEPVPFRFTPNIQKFITANGTEGLFTGSLMAIARCLTEPEVCCGCFFPGRPRFTHLARPQFELDDYLSIFIRDELITWNKITHASSTSDDDLHEKVTQNVAIVLKKAQDLSCKTEREKVSLWFDFGIVQ